MTATRPASGISSAKGRTARPGVDGRFALGYQGRAVPAIPGTPPPGYGSPFDSVDRVRCWKCNKRWTKADPIQGGVGDVRHPRCGTVRPDPSPPVPVVPPLVGRAHPEEERLWDAEEGPDGWNSPGLELGEIERAYCLAIEELAAEGRVEAEKLEKCRGSYARVMAWTGREEHPHGGHVSGTGCLDYVGVQGSCGLRCCPICGLRYSRRKRDAARTRFGSCPYLMSIVLTVPPDQRDRHTPGASSYWQARLARALEDWFFEMFRVCPAGEIVMHYTGTESSTSGTFLPHYNILLLWRGRHWITVHEPWIDGDGKARVRTRYKLGGVVHLETLPGMGKAYIVGDLKDSLSGALKGAIEDGTQKWPDYERKTSQRKVNHIIRYVHRPPGEGYPDLQARWTWPRCRFSRPFGAIATGRAESFAELNPITPEEQERWTSEGESLQRAPIGAERAGTAEPEAWVPDRRLAKAMQRWIDAGEPVSGAAWRMYQKELGRAMSGYGPATPGEFEDRWKQDWKRKREAG